jgi:hypothetical protein
MAVVIHRAPRPGVSWVRGAAQSCWISSVAEDTLETPHSKRNGETAQKQCILLRNMSSFTSSGLGTVAQSVLGSDIRMAPSPDTADDSPPHPTTVSQEQSVS